MDNKQSSLIFGVALIFFGLVGLAANLILPLFGFSLWRLWPLIVVGLGLCLSLGGLLSIRRPGLGGLFIPGLPILTTGGILLCSSLFHMWDVWSWAWPLEVLAVGLGFLFAAFGMRVIWLLIPAFIIGANGLVLAFCNLTGMWDAWAFLWTVEPLSLGLALAVIGFFRRSSGLILAGAIVGGIGAIFLALFSPFFFLGWRTFSLAGPLALILGGLALLFAGPIGIWLSRRSDVPRQETA